MRARGDGGRHGLGKSTIASASQLRTFFGATVPSDTKLLLAQGQICLKPHKVVTGSAKAKIYDAYGVWYDDGDGEESPFIGRRATSFLHTFNLERGHAPGLSLVIPFPHEDLTEEAIIRETIAHCFHQIVSRQLVVEAGSTVIDASTIKVLAEKHDMTSIKSALSLSETAAKGLMKFAQPTASGTTGPLEASHFDAATLKALQKRWIDGDTIGVRLPVVVRRKGSPAQTGEVGLYLRREQNAELTRETYVRGRVSVPFKMLSAGSNCIALLVADEQVVSTFLGDAEPPAHDRWQLAPLKARYYRPEEALNRIKTGLRNLLNIVDAGEERRAVKDAFSNYLWTPPLKDDDDSSPGDTNRKRKGRQDDSGKPKESSPQPHRLERVDGGFRYLYAPEGEDVSSVRISVVYCRRGVARAAKSAKFLDFPGKVPFKASGTATVSQVVEPRRLEIRLDEIEPGYEMLVTGFDVNRDIELKLQASD